VTFEESGLSEVQEIVRGGEGNKLMAELRSLVSEMDSTEAALLTTREMDAARDRAKTLVFLLATLAVAVAGFLILFRGIRREMTSRARAEEELRRSEESLEVTLHSIGDAVLATNTEGCITRMNPVAEKLTGWKQAEALGRPIAEVFRIINEETRQPAVIPVEKVLETGEVQGLANHTVLIARDGTERPIADSAAPIRARDGKILGVVLVCRDVSSERDAAVALEYERYLLNALMDNMTADIYFKDRESRILRSNRSHARRLGLDDPAKAVGRTDFDFFSAEHAEQAAEDERRVIQTGEPVSKEEKETWPDGRVSWAFSVKVPLLDKQGKTAGTFGISHDISARKKTEEQIARLNADLQRKAAELEVANKELEAFSYSVSHDLRAPLRHVLGYVEMLTRETQDQLSEKSRRFLKTISDAGSDMGKLIDDLLSFSRMGRAELREEVVDLNVLFDEVCGELAESTVGRDIRWTVARLPEVHGDRAMLKQVLANLLGNSIKYTRSRTPAEIDVGFTKDGDGQLAFHVRDNGAGFDMKYADKLFGVFQRLHRPDEFEGTGIGLANVRRVVARHGGRTWAEGKPDHGATFYFTLRPA